MGRIARHVDVSGRVQGVFFRAWTEEQAERLGVGGWIRNCPDGSVQAHLEGEEGAVNWLIDLIGDGPPSARVAQVRVRDAEVEGLTSFEVRR
jgi:acylphosphatase